MKDLHKSSLQLSASKVAARRTEITHEAVEEQAIIAL